MRGKTLGNNFRAARKRGGFTLIELLIVVVIMAILVGVTGSLLAGFYDVFDATTDSATARRRANDVFNILKAPILSAGLGMSGTNLGFYFEAGAGSPLEEWSKPVEVVDDSRVEGNALKIAYALPTGIKYLYFNDGSENVIEAINAFRGGDGAHPDDVLLDPTNLGMLVGTSSFVDANPATRIVAGAPDVRSFIAFPGVNMRPMFVEEIIGIGGTGLKLRGKVLQKNDANRDRTIFTNTILSFDDICAIRAGVACVVKSGASSSFYLLDVCTEDPLGPTGTFDVPKSPGFRVEGIRAVSFDVDPQYRSITVWVLAEGDVAKGGRNTPQRVFDRWDDLISGGADALNKEVYYEDFQMTWRTHNVQNR